MKRTTSTKIVACITGLEHFRYCRILRKRNMSFVHLLVIIFVTIITLECIQSNSEQVQHAYKVIPVLDNVDRQPACVTGSPSSEAPARSLVHCASRCTEQGCSVFNVLTGGNNMGKTAKISCQLFDEEADSANIVIITGCSAYRVVDEDGRSSTALSSQNLFPLTASFKCWLPFTLNGTLHYRCTNNTNSTMIGIGCFVANRTWITCPPPTNFTANYTNMQMTTTLITRGQVAIMSINSWITIQNKVVNGAVSFSKNWTEYRNGFGEASLADNYWLGNELISQLTMSARYSLRVEIQRSDLQWYSVEYATFVISPESLFYKLSATGYSGDTVDAINAASSSFAASKNKNFTTFDSDNDVSPNTNCAVSRGGGWWYSSCSSSQLNKNDDAIWGITSSSYDVIVSHLMIRAG